MIEEIKENKERYMGNVGYLVSYIEKPNIFSRYDETEKYAFMTAAVLAYTVRSSFSVRVLKCEYGTYRDFVSSYPELAFFEWFGSFEY